MNILEILILGGIIAMSLIWIVSYVIYPFKKKNNPCGNCPYSNVCNEEKK